MREIKEYMKEHPSKMKVVIRWEYLGEDHELPNRGRSPVWARDRDELEEILEDLRNESSYRWTHRPEWVEESSCGDPIHESFKDVPRKPADPWKWG